MKPCATLGPDERRHERAVCGAEYDLDEGLSENDIEFMRRVESTGALLHSFLQPSIIGNLGSLDALLLSCREIISYHNHLMKLWSLKSKFNLAVHSYSAINYKLFVSCATLLSLKGQALMSRPYRWYI